MPRLQGYRERIHQPFWDSLIRTTGVPDTAAPIALEAVTNPDLANWDGATVFPSAAQATAVGAAITALKNNQATQSDAYDVMAGAIAGISSRVGIRDYQVLESLDEFKKSSMEYF